MSRKTSERRYIRSVISRVHPDLFEGHEEQQRVNTESLKTLHAAVETLSTSKHADPINIEFFQREQDEAGNFLHVALQLTNSLVPLYEAFGVISPEDAQELRDQEHDDSRSVEDVNFLQWLESTIQEATLTAADLANQKQLLSQLQASVTTEFGLACVKLGTQNAAGLSSVSEVLDHIEALTVIQDALHADPEVASRLAGLVLRVHCPRHAPIRDYHWVDYDSGEDFHISTRKWAEIGVAGEVEVVAHRTGVAERLRSLDYRRAHQLSSVAMFWKGRQDALARAAAAVLRVKFVWPDENCCETDFCMWAGRVLRDKLLSAELADAQFSFTMLVHSDDQAPTASFLPASSTVQVHHHCSPRQLMELLLSNAAIAASSTSGERLETATAEQELLSAAKAALGARHVVRICARDKGERVTTALQRLIENAPLIKQRIDLRGVCLAIDDNYHLWDSGYVSIPYNFDIDSMAGEVTKLLAPAADMPEAAGMADVHQAAAEAAAAAAAAADALAEQTATADDATAADMARVHPQYQSAEEFIANLKDTMDGVEPAGHEADSMHSMDGAPMVDESLASWIEGQVGDLGAGVSTFAAGAMASSSRVDVQPGAGIRYGAATEALASGGSAPRGATEAGGESGVDAVVPEIPDHVRAAAAAGGAVPGTTPAGLPVIPRPYSMPEGDGSCSTVHSAAMLAGPMGKLADAVRLVKSRSGSLRRRSDGGASSGARRSPSPIAAHASWPSGAVSADVLYDMEDLPCDVDKPLYGGDSAANGEGSGGTGGPAETPHDSLKVRQVLARGVTAASLPMRNIPVPSGMSPVKPPSRGAGAGGAMGSPTKLAVRPAVAPRSRRGGGPLGSLPGGGNRRHSCGGGMLR
eukprot:jgi/Ulvmu1/10112/UM006_0062.1